MRLPTAHTGCARGTHAIDKEDGLDSRLFRVGAALAALVAVTAPALAIGAC